MPRMEKVRVPYGHQRAGIRRDEVVESLPIDRIPDEAPDLEVRRDEGFIGEADGN